MKKRTFIIPVILLVVAIVCGVVMTICSTTLLTTDTISSSQSTPAHDARLKKYAEMAYRFDNNYSNLNMCANLYRSKVYIYEKERVASLPADYAEKCVLYSKALFEMDPKEYRGLNNIATITGDPALTIKNQNACNYFVALYFTGQTELAKSEMEKYVDEFVPQYYMEHNELLQGFLMYVYNETDDEKDKEWAASMRDRIKDKVIAAFPENYPDGDETNNSFSLYGFYLDT